MKNQLFKGMALIIILSLLSGAAAAFAQGEGPRDPLGFERMSQRFSAGRASPRPEAPLRFPGKPALGDADAGGELGAAALASPLVPSGEPGVTYSHAQTFGVAETAYISDTSHFMYPEGVGAAGTSIWIADSQGNRALKYDSSGNWQQTIGRAGFARYEDDEDLAMEFISDVTVDNQGDVWLVDEDGSYLLEFSSLGVLKNTLGSPWERGEDDYLFNSPVSAAFDASNNLYVSDRWNHRIQVYNSSLEYIATLGSYGSGNYGFDTPGRIAIYGTTLYVADTYNHRGQLFDISNPLAITYSATLGSSGSGPYNFSRPFGVAVNGSYIFVADAGNHRVQAYNRTTRVYVGTIGGYGSTNGRFIYPTDVAVDSSGNLYVADSLNHRIQKFTSGLAFNRIFGTTGVPYLTDMLHYHAPEGVAVTPGGEIVVAEADGQRVLKLKSDGSPLWAFGEAGICEEDTSHLCYPVDVEVAPDGRIFVADGGNSRVVVLSAGGAFITSFGGFGDDDGEFYWPTAVAIDSRNNLIYVADSGDYRVQAFNLSTYAYVAQFGGYGAGNGKFKSLRDIAVDSSGQIYVLDLDNHCVQVFNANRVYQRSIGVAGSPGSAYNRLDYPVALAVDARDRVFIATEWGTKIKVYDKTGAFLDCIDNSWGSFQGMFRAIRALEADQDGNLYIADFTSHQVKRYIPGPYPGWRQVNVTGMGEHYNWGVWSLTTYNDALYFNISTSYDFGTSLYKYQAGVFTQVMSGGFGDTDNRAINSFETFNGKLYAGVWNQSRTGSSGAQIYRTSNPDTGPWENVVTGGFGNPDNGEVIALRAFDGYLYAATLPYGDPPEPMIYRSATGDSGDWQKVYDSGTPGFANAEAVLDMAVFNGALYAGMYSPTTGGAELWRTSDGVTWNMTAPAGFGAPWNDRVSALAVFDGQLYAGVLNWNRNTGTSTGGKVYRSSDGAVWEAVESGGFGDVWNLGVTGLVVYRGMLYAVTTNIKSGVEVWRSASGDAGSWERVGWHSFGKEVPSAYYLWNFDHAVYEDLLYIGTYRYSGIGGGRLWSFLPEQVYLPLMLK